MAVNRPGRWGGSDPIPGDSCAHWGEHKMLWFCCLPHLTGHKMSGNYIRVIPPVSTFTTKILRNPRSGTSQPPGTRPLGYCGGVLRRSTAGDPTRIVMFDCGLGELQRGSQVGEPEGATKEASCQRSRQNVAPPSVFRAAALYPR